MAQTTRERIGPERTTLRVRIVRDVRWLYERELRTAPPHERALLLQKLAECEAISGELLGFTEE